VTGLPKQQIHEQTVTSVAVQRTDVESPAVTTSTPIAVSFPRGLASIGGLKRARAHATRRRHDHSTAAPVTLGGEHDPFVLQYRISMASLSRLRTHDTSAQSIIAVTYYEQRTTLGGLLVTEPTDISPTARSNLGSPDIFTPPQARGSRSQTWSTPRTASSSCRFITPDD
jgi:hypothetical protein